MKFIIFCISVPLLLSETTTANAAVECCRTAVYPESKVWINTQGSKINYTLYDTYGLIEKVFVSEVDDNGVLKPAHVVDAQASAILCPPKHKTANPKHADLTKGEAAQVLCINKDNKLKANKWYGVCRQRPCTSCHVDLISNTDPDPKYISIKSTKIRGNSLVVEFAVATPGVSYNVSLEVMQDSLAEFVIGPGQRTYTLQIPEVSDKAFRYPVYLFVDPFVKSSFGCPVVGRRQITTLPPFTRAST